MKGLALDLFMHHPGENLSDDHSDVVELSDFLRRTGELMGWPIPQNFRSPYSVLTRLAHFSHLDPSHIEAGRQGLPNGAVSGNARLGREDRISAEWRYCPS